MMLVNRSHLHHALINLELIYLFVCLQQKNFHFYSTYKIYSVLLQFIPQIETISPFPHLGHCFPKSRNISPKLALLAYALTHSHVPRGGHPLKCKH